MQKCVLKKSSFKAFDNNLNHMLFERENAISVFQVSSNYKDSSNSTHLLCIPKCFAQYAQCRNQHALYRITVVSNPRQSCMPKSALGCEKAADPLLIRFTNALWDIYKVLLSIFDGFCITMSLFAVNFKGILANQRYHWAMDVQYNYTLVEVGKVSISIIKRLSTNVCVLCGQKNVCMFLK